MAFDFPSSPSVGQSYQGYTWDGEKWAVSASGGKMQRFIYTPAAGTTVLSGADAAGLTLAYTPGAVEVVINGIWVPYTDYTATNGTSITLNAATASGDLIYVYALSNFAVLDAVALNSVQSNTAGQKLQGRSNIDALGSVNIQVITASGTYTPAANMRYAVIECLGGGGGGGGAAGNVAYFLSASGGGAGAYSRKIVSAATVGASQTVTIGAAGAAAGSGDSTGGTGGDTSVGTLCVAKGGSGGQGSSNAHGSSGGAGGSAASGTGDVKTNGANGLAGAYQQFAATATILNYYAGTGASSPYGAGGAPGAHNGSNSAVNGNPATGYGSGGGAGVSNQIASNSAGGAGTAGLVIITEFCG